MATGGDFYLAIDKPPGTKGVPTSMKAAPRWRCNHEGSVVGVGRLDPQ